MNESLTCPNCGQTINSSKTHGLEDSKVVTCNACKLRSSLGEWRLNASPISDDSVNSAKIALPPLPKSEHTHRNTTSVSADDPSITPLPSLPLWIGGAGLLLVSLSPFFKWINIGVGGITGLAGDGKIVLAISLVAFGAFVLATVKREWMWPILLGMQAWGTIVVFWMGSLLWKLSSLASDPEVKDNVFAAMFSTMLVSPGAGLYLGLVGGVTIVGAIGYIAVFYFLERKRPLTYIAIQAIAVCAGIAIVVFLGPAEFPAGNNTKSSKVLGFGALQGREESIVEAALGESFILGNLEITPVEVSLVTLHERTMFGESEPRETKSFLFTFSAENVSDGQVFAPFTTIDVTDNFGNSCPDPTDSAGFSTRVTIDGNDILRKIRPGETATVMVAFDPQLANASSYSCVLTTNTSNQDDYRKWQIRIEPGNANRL